MAVSRLLLFDGIWLDSHISFQLFYFLFLFLFVLFFGKDFDLSRSHKDTPAWLGLKVSLACYAAVILPLSLAWVQSDSHPYTCGEGCLSNEEDCAMPEFGDEYARV